MLAWEGVNTQTIGRVIFHLSSPLHTPLHRFACPVDGHCLAGMKIKFTAS
jgi:hypothetical protein